MNNYVLPKIISEFQDIIVVNYNCLTFKDNNALNFDSSFIEIQKQFVLSCAKICKGKLIKSDGTVLVFKFSNILMLDIFKSAFEENFEISAFLEELNHSVT